MQALREAVNASYWPNRWWVEVTTEDGEVTAKVNILCLNNTYTFSVIAPADREQDLTYLSELLAPEVVPS